MKSDDARDQAMPEDPPDSSLAPLELTGSETSLSETELGQLLRANRPVPPSGWSERFWQELEPRLEAGGASSQPDIRPNPRIWLRPPLLAAAAALIVLLLSLPMTRQLAQQEASLESTGLSQDKPAQPGSPPMRLGASAPEEAKQADRAKAPAMAEHSNLDGQSGPAAKGDAVVNKREQNHNTASQTLPQSLAKERAEPPSSTQADPGLNDARTHSPGDHPDPLALQLQAMLGSMEAKVSQLQPGRYEIRLPASRRDELKTRLKTWQVPHTLLEQALKERGQIVYRLEID
ncbi:MAG: hypothetical protein CVV27_12505 [Candidatus Melainabacteria bacterium HGW-Melainabacteria-1]|nr:MAG: hypothetical protein CVV27_12505 [Candidatus Melainabacteria bacterium HGW-Melainabacteria-1]